MADNSRKDATRYIVINADDFGYCDQRNRGIVESIQSGVVSSTSLLVNADKSLEAVKLAREYSIPLGLHLNLTEGRTIKSRLSSLTLANGFMRGKFGFRKALKNGEIELNEIKEEVECQLQWFIDNVGSLPTHIDGHQHVHVLPRVCAILCKVMKKFGICWTRVPVEINLEECVWIEEPVKNFNKSVMADAENSKSTFSNYGIRFSSHFIGHSTMGKDMTISRLERAIKNVFTKDSEEVCELMVHPGYKSVIGCGGCGEGPDLFACSDDREHELETLKSTTLQEYLKFNNIRVCSFQELNLVSDPELLHVLTFSQLLNP